jgi:cytochrome c553
VIRILIGVAVLIAASLGAGAVLFAWIGLYSVAASEGHWPVTRWFLEFAMRRSVATHALTLEASPAMSEAMVLRGLGHFVGACAPCHGAPGEPRNEVVRNMLPPPPDLARQAPTWRDEQLFWIVKHGLKYTGMPAWPAQQRDDEVWAMVAFLRRLPDLAPDEYRSLARKDLLSLPAEAEPMEPLGDLAERSRSALVTCARCHGVRGEGGGKGAFPRIAGQSQPYLAAALRAYATGSRPSGIMQPIARELDEKTIGEIAAYFAAIDPRDRASAAPQTGSDAPLGAAIARDGLPERGIAPCSSCHEPDGAAANPLYPSLAGQSAEFLDGQLRLWRDGVRGGSAAAPIMETLADGLTDREIAALATYYSSLRPQGRRPGHATAGEP